MNLIQILSMAMLLVEEEVELPGEFFMVSHSGLEYHHILRRFPLGRAICMEVISHLTEALKDQKQDHLPYHHTIARKIVKDRDALYKERQKLNVG
jgi:hypothetical protein